MKSATKMFSVVRMKNTNEKFVWKTKWIRGMNSAQTVRYGFRQNEDKYFFHSPDPTAQPDFSLAVEDVFIATNVACYKGRVIKTFGK